MIYDAIIIGGGAAGMTAGIYLSRAQLKVLILELGVTGGLTATTDMIENYPGFPDGVDGMKLMDLFRQQAEKFGAEFKELTEVKAVDFSAKIKKILTNKGEFEGRGILIASGSIPKKLGPSNEEKFVSRGISYCATCDGAFFKDKKVFVVGGGDSAVKEANFLTRFAKEVVIIHRRDKFRADKINMIRAEQNPKISFKLNSEIVEIDGSLTIEKAKIMDKVKNEVYEESVDGIFVYIGQEPNTKFLAGQVDLNELGFVKSDIHMKTSVDGVFVAGDVREHSKRQTSISVGDAATASINLEEWLSEN